MSQEFNRGIALGLILSYFVLGNVLNALGLGWLALYATIGLAIYFFIKKD